MNRELPEIIKQVGFDFSWDEERVWRLNVPADKIPITDLEWHFDIPFIWSKPNGYYDLKPRDVLENPEKYPEEYSRTMQANTNYPIDIMLWRGRWLILDGLHRLMREFIEGKEIINVRKISESAIPLIRKTR